MLDEIGDCTHRKPSDGQAMCSCGHRERELQYLAGVLERARDERLAAVERLVEAAEARADSSLSRMFDGRPFGAWVPADELRAALGKEAS